MGLITKFNSISLTLDEMKEMLAIAKGIRKEIKNTIDVNDKVEYYESLAALCFLISSFIILNNYSKKYNDYFQSLLPSDKYYKDGTPYEYGYYNFPVDKTDTNLNRGFYKYRLIWLNLVIELLEIKIEKYET